MAPVASRGVTRDTHRVPAPVSYFVRLERPVTDAERDRLREHVQQWSSAFAKGASGYQLEPVQLAEAPAVSSTGNGNGSGTHLTPAQGVSGDERGFADRMRRANVRTLVELALTLSAQGRAPSREVVDAELREGNIRLVGRTHLGPSWHRDLATLLDALRELETLLPDADVRVHDGQQLRFARPRDVKLA